MSNIRDFDPKHGMAFQGDVAIVPIPDSIAKRLSRSEEIKPIHGRLILQEGEVSGHHHAIALMERPADMQWSPAVDALMADALAGRIELPNAKMFRDASLINELVHAKLLTRSDLAVGVLVVSGGPMTVSHEEHDSIRLPVGSYYIGRQVESAGAEERRVAD